uniref:tRNA (adenine(58)-N(1))-methyltransferase non-catalytic subunit TRM6 n=1 Tax=Clastoptera arizonana TaxID=38151 RepID=A0A1B6D8D8_9HEMI
MECCTSDFIVKVGYYVIVQRQNYSKLHLLSEKCPTIFLGRDQIDLSTIIGMPFGSNFKMVPKIGTKREFTLNVCSLKDLVSSDTLLKDISSGIDNRNIFDDGSSQLLSSDSILELRDSGISPQQIVGQLIENSKTFKNKTEYSQEKYLKKKDKKYFEYISIYQPTLRLLVDYFYNRGIPKNIGLRIDTLSQITTAVNFQPDGTYILCENGFHGIVAASCLNNLSNDGQLIIVTPGSQGQKQAILAMNFNDQKLSRLLTVRVSTFIDYLEKKNIQNFNDNNVIKSAEILTSGTSNAIQDSTMICCESKEKIEEGNISKDLRKRKYSNDDNSDETNFKKPKWAEEAEKAADILKCKKIDGIIIASKEYPANILNTFLPYLAPSRPFVVYSLYQEPLVQLYIDLKKRRDIIYLRISETWLRSYQVLPDRTHPSVMMNPTSGYLLSGLIVENEII